MFNGQASTMNWVVSQIPSGLFILTTACDGLRQGVLAMWVQRCAIEPPMVMVAIPKGQPVEPLILDSRGFALCQISVNDRFLLRKFAPDGARGGSVRCHSDLSGSQRRTDHPIRGELPRL